MNVTLDLLIDIYTNICINNDVHKYHKVNISE